MRVGSIFTSGGASETPQSNRQSTTSAAMDDAEKAAMALKVKEMDKKINQLQQSEQEQIALLNAEKLEKQALT